MKKYVSHAIISALAWGLTLGLPGLGAQAQMVTQNQDYYRDVVNLSELLGKAHAIRIVCNGRNDQHWRSYMQRMLELEAPYQGGLRRSMVDAFNAGYNVGTMLHDECSRETVAAEKAYAEAGRALTLRLTTQNIPGGNLPDN